MKSYEDHIHSLIGKSPSNICNRSSSIFPIFFDSQISMRLLFLNYWQLKRKIDHLLCRLYLRDVQGQTVFKKCFYVEELKSFEIDLSHIIGRRYPFGGSLEIEFASPSNLVFPYPAVVVHYEGAHFSTFVHSAQRTFNDDKDQNANSRKVVIESGFNIYADKETSPFLTFVNGPKAVEKQTLNLAAYNLDQKVIGAQIQLNCKPYETVYISLDKWKELVPHLNHRVGCMKVQLFNTSTFPRLLVGNRNKKDASMSITHTYYDLSLEKKKSDYWKAEQPQFQAAALALPCKTPELFDTRVYFYPIYSPGEFSIDVEVYDLNGQLIDTLKQAHTLSSPKFTFLDLASLSSKLDPHENYCFKFIVTSSQKHIPARIKIGFDVGFKKRGFSCNICTNFYPANPTLDKKKKTFKWAPLFPQKIKGSIWCLNEAPKENYTQEAKVKVTFYRSQDSRSLTRSYTLAAHGAQIIEHDEELAEFFENKVGWCSFESENPYITTYYFSEHPSKMMGGDHGF